MSSPISEQYGTVENQNLQLEQQAAERKATQSVAPAEEIQSELQDKGSGAAQGDKVSLSGTAQGLAKYQEEPVELADGEYKVAAVVPENSEAVNMATATMKSGRTLVVDRIISSPEGREKTNENLFGYRANVYKPGGELEFSFIMQRDTIFNENEDGSLNVQDYIEGAESSGDDYIVGHEGKNMKGGAGDDTVILSKGEFGSVRNIDTRAGDDSIQAQGAIRNVNINTGAGNDVVAAEKTIRFSNVDTGDGDDLIPAKDGFYKSSVSTGRGMILFADIRFMVEFLIRQKAMI